MVHDTMIRLVQGMAGQVIVVKNAMYAKTSRFLSNPYYAADAFDAQFRTALIGGGKKNFNPNTGPDWRAFAAED
jgi:hypothetical protein